MNRGVTARVRTERGMSLVEVTIILLVIASLTAVAAPTIGDYLSDARNTKAKDDVETIASGIDQMLRNTATRCLSLNGSSCANTATGRVELLVSGTSVSANEPAVSSADATVTASTASATSLNWAGATSNAVATARRALMDDQLVTNAAGYSTTGLFTSGGGPRPALGWRGAYLAGPITADPWNHMYQANTVFLSVASDAADGTGEGQLRGGWTEDVIVVSAGPNGNIQTAFGTTGATAAGDDVIAVVQGATR